MAPELLNARDAELLRLSATRADAFAVFYRRYERLVGGWLVRRTGRADLAAELTAKVFAAAYVGATRFVMGLSPRELGRWGLRGIGCCSVDVKPGVNVTDNCADEP
jgi:DNA-directed RNA polymerase specialized sigma24 family protein